MHHKRKNKIMPVSYIGGKSRIGKWIKGYIPYDIETYVECFGGMYWTFFCLDLDKYKNLKTVVYNDFNPLNVNVFNCLKDHKKFNEVINFGKILEKRKQNQINNILKNITKKHMIIMVKKYV